METELFDDSIRKGEDFLVMETEILAGWAGWPASQQSGLGLAGEG